MTSSLRDRRRRRTRSALLSAGRTLLAARDIGGISVDEIVAAADVAKGSFYNHFPDKDGFARAIGAAVRREVERAVAAANQQVTDPAHALARGLCVFVRYAIEQPDSAQVLWRLNPGATMADAPINRALREDVARGIRTRRFSDIDVETGVLLVIGAVVVAMRHVLEERVTTPARRIAERMSAAMLRACGLTSAAAGDVAANACMLVFAPGMADDEVSARRARLGRSGNG